MFAPLLIIIVAVALVFAGNKDNSSSPQTAGCGKYRNDKTVTINGRNFKAETPYDQAAFNKGLGGRPCIESSEAMLFPFKAPGQYAFWMKDMRFPIDIIWIGPDQKVAWADADIKPETYPTKFANPNDHPAQFILELKANTIKDLNLQQGTPVSF